MALKNFKSRHVYVFLGHNLGQTLMVLQWTVPNPFNQIDNCYLRCQLDTFQKVWNVAECVQNSCCLWHSELQEGCAVLNEELTLENNWAQKHRCVNHLSHNMDEKVGLELKPKLHLKGLITLKLSWMLYIKGFKLSSNSRNANCK